MAAIHTGQTHQGISLSITRADGSPAPVDGPPIWASSDETVYRVEPAADGMSTNGIPVAPGTARISVSADADMGTGVSTITGVSEDIVVSVDPDSLASVMTLTIPTPVDNP